MRKIVGTVLLITVFIAPGFAQLVRTYSNDFLNIGVGARGLAMSNAQVALTDDIYSTYYNPAGLVYIPNTFQIGIMHSEYFAGIGKYDYGAIAIPVKQQKSVIGFSFFRFGVDDIPNTLYLVQPDGSVDYTKITLFSSADYAFQFHYAQMLPIPGLSVGGSAKIIYRQIGNFAKAFGFGLDIGLQYHLKQWRFGFMARDATGTFDAWSMTFNQSEQQQLVQEGQQLPQNSLEVATPKLILGAAREIKLARDKLTISPEADLVFTTDGKENVLVPAKPVSMDAQAGLEIKYTPAKDIDISFRAGVGNIQRSTDEVGNKIFTVSPNIGAGIHIKIISVDYALTNLTTIQNASNGAGLYSNVISIRLDITKRVQKE